MCSAAQTGWACRLYELYRLWVQDAYAYHNQEIRIWLNSYPSGVRKLYYDDLLAEFNGDDGPAIKAKLKNKPVLVTGLVREVKEEDYFTNPGNAESNQGKVMAIRFSHAGNTFMGYLFDDPIDPSILIKDEHTVEMLCGEIQPGVGDVDMQGKCKVVGVGLWYKIVDGKWDYMNQELFTWLNTPAEAEAE